MNSGRAELARLGRLTPLRFVAALLVVLFHFGGSVLAADAPWLRPIVSHGSVAVSFFFCLSGFVMGSVFACFNASSNLRASASPRVFSDSIDWSNSASRRAASAARIRPASVSSGLSPRSGT